MEYTIIHEKREWHDIYYLVLSATPDKMHKTVNKNLLQLAKLQYNKWKLTHESSTDPST
jgi:hypothetical protein